MYEDKEHLIRLRPELIGLTALNPFCNHNSASRSLMESSHLSQMLTLNNGDEKIIQSGMEKELAKSTFNKVLKNDSRIISVIPRYRKGVDINAISTIVEIVVIYEDLVLNEISHMELPYNSTMHNYFGFKYKWNNKVLNNVSHNQILKAGTVLAESPAVADNDGYKFGLNLNVALMSINEAAEDGIVISKSTAKRLGITIFEKRTVEFGADAFMLNIYGDVDNYKPFPEIGENIHESGAIMVTRNYDDELAPALTSKKDILDFDPIFDNATYVRDKTGVVRDIKVYHTPRNKKEVYSNTDQLVNKYRDAFIQFHKDILETYDNIVEEHKNRYNDSELKFSPAFTRYMVNTMSLVDSSNDKTERRIKKLYKNDAMDIYRIDFVISYEVPIGVGFKISDLSGGKSIICEVRNDHDMPYTVVDGQIVRSDMISDPASTISRMNIGRLYDSYMAKASRKVKHIITEEIIAIDDLDDLDSTINTINADIIDSLFSIVLDFLKLIDNVQYKAYKAVTSSKQKRIILKEVVNKELFVYYSVGDKPAYKIIDEINKSRFKPHIGKVHFKQNGKLVTTKENIMISPMYIILLAKIADTWLSTSSAKVNHYGLPTGTSKGEKHRLPWRNSPTKTLGETEARLYGSYVGQKFLTELKDRGSSIATHEYLYGNILNADNPTNIDTGVDRDKVPYGQDKALELSNGIINAAGMMLAHKEDEQLMHVNIP